MFKLRSVIGFNEVDDSISSLHFDLILDEAEVVGDKPDAGVGVRLCLWEFENVSDILYFAHFSQINYKLESV
jgi:hypothetical protein